ncbi:MAG: family 43 glycosylhydrolase [Luteolibacter sp.]
MNKKTIIALLMVAAGVSFANSQEITYPHKFKAEGNPIVRHISSTDPDVHVWDGVIWMYCAQDHPMEEGDKGEYERMDGYHVFSSTDMVNWTDHGEILHSRDISWGRGGWLWAPCAARKDGKYYLYFPIKDQRNKWRIGVAIADHPTGPFKEIGNPIAGAEGIDPSVFIDDDGEAYIYCGQAKVAKLKPNMIELAEPLRQIDYAPEEVLKDGSRRFLEASYMHKRNGIYYYSYTNFRGKKLQGFYGMGKSPYGPFEWKGAMAPKPEGSQYHHSIIEWKGQAYDFYHVGGFEFKPDGYKGSRRLVAVDKLYYNEDGTIRMLEQTPKK